MVIECTACHTRFKLADDKLKPGGTKVRCSKCKQIFTVMPPEPEPAPEPVIAAPAVIEEEIDFGEFNMERLAGEAEGAAAAAATKSEEFAFGGKEETSEPGEFAFEKEEKEPSFSPEEFDFGGAEETAGPSEFAFEEETAGPSEFAFEEETAGPSEFSFEKETTGPSEFAFEEEEEKTSDEPSFGREEAGEFAFEEEAAGPSEFPFEKEATGPSEFPFEKEPTGPSEFAFEEEEEKKPGEPSFGREEEEFVLGREGEGGGSEFAFGEEGAEEFSFDTEEETGAPKEFAFEEDEAGGPSEFSFEEEEHPLDTGGDFAWDVEEEGEGGDEFGFGEPEDRGGEAENFDFSGITFGEEEAPAAPPIEEERSAPSRMQPAVEEAESLRPLREALVEAPPAPRREHPATPHQPAAIHRRKSPVSLAMLMAVLLLALAGGAVYFYWQGAIPQLSNLVDRLTGQTAPSEVGGQIRLESLTSYYVTNREAGQLLVIQGQAVNDYPQTRSSIAVKGVLFNKAGNAVLQQTVFCGNPLDQQSLKSQSFAKIEESMNNPFGESLSNLNVAPGKTLPFTIVFRNLPPDIAEFTIEPADSKPGTKQ